MSPRCTLTKVSVGCMVDWLSGFIDATPEQLAAHMYACLSAALREAYATGGHIGGSRSS
jgi:hypothetical protein